MTPTTATTVKLTVVLGARQVGSRPIAKVANFTPPFTHSVSVAPVCQGGASTATGKCSCSNFNDCDSCLSSSVGCTFCGLFGTMTGNCQGNSTCVNGATAVTTRECKCSNFTADGTPPENATAIGCSACLSSPYNCSYCTETPIKGTCQGKRIFSEFLLIFSSVFLMFRWYTNINFRLPV